MVTLLALLLSFTFIILSGFHFYWLFGGTWGLRNVIPSKADVAKSFAIPKFATLFVAIALLCFAFIYFVKANMIAFKLPNGILNYIFWSIPSIFTLRAIGDFKYLGLFKTVKNTAFAKADALIFIPLCMCIGCIGFVLQFY